MFHRLYYLDNWDIFIFPKVEASIQTRGKLMIYSEQMVMKNKGPKFISVVTTQWSSCAINRYYNGINQNGTNDHNPYSLWHSLEIRIEDPVFLGVVRNRGDSWRGGNLCDGQDATAGTTSTGWERGQGIAGSRSHSSSFTWAAPAGHSQVSKGI